MSLNECLLSSRMRDVAGDRGLISWIASEGYNPPMHFYLTCSNVELGHLEFATNNTALEGMKRLNWRSKTEEPVISSDQYDIIDSAAESQLDRLKLAVFASMEISM